MKKKKEPYRMLRVDDPWGHVYTYTVQVRHFWRWCTIKNFFVNEYDGDESFACREANELLEKLNE